MPEDRPWIDIEHIFWPRLWDRPRNPCVECQEDTGPGMCLCADAKAPKNFFDGLTGETFCGTPEQWLNGASIRDPVPHTINGIPVCCGPTTRARCVRNTGGVGGGVCAARIVYLTECSGGGVGGGRCEGSLVAVCEGGGTGGGYCVGDTEPIPPPECPEWSPFRIEWTNPEADECFLCGMLPATTDVIGPTEEDGICIWEADGVGGPCDFEDPFTWTLRVNRTTRAWTATIATVGGDVVYVGDSEFDEFLVNEATLQTDPTPNTLCVWPESLIVYLPE